MASTRHPLPILNISEHLTRLRLQTNTSLPFGAHILSYIFWSHSCLVLGALLGTQNGREVEIVNTFEVAAEQDERVDHGSFNVRKEQCALVPRMCSARLIALSTDKQVFPSLEFIGWYTVASYPTSRHIALHEQVCFTFPLYRCHVTPSSSPHIVRILSY
jgi:COP9 signalosome complex subunit 6